MKRDHGALLAAGIALATALVPAESALAQQPIVIKFSHVVALDTPKGKGAEHFTGSGMLPIRTPSFFP